MPRVLALALLAACGAAAVPREPPPRPAPWCFAILALHYGERHLVRGCADTRELCSFARDRAFTLAGIAGFEAIGDCRLAK